MRTDGGAAVSAAAHALSRGWYRDAMGSRKGMVESGSDGAAPRSDSTPDIRALATAAALRSLLFAALPIPITPAAITVSPLLPYAVGALVSFALVGACVFLAIFYGCRVLRITRRDAAAEPATGSADTGRRSAASIAASAAAGRAIARRRNMGVVGIVLGSLHGLFLLGSLALGLPGMLWLASVHA